MHEWSDDAIEAVLRGTLADEVAALPRESWREGVRERVRARHPRPRRLDRRVLLLPGLAAALVLTLGAWLVGAPVAPTPETGYEAIFVRVARNRDLMADALHVVAARLGNEREIALVPVSAFGVWYHLNHIGEVAISPTGRLAVHSGGKSSWLTSVIDLADPTADVIALDHGAETFDPRGRAWVPTGDHVRVFDPATGAELLLPRPPEFTDSAGDRAAYAPSTLGPFLADSSGFVLSDRLIRLNQSTTVPARVAVLEDDASAGDLGPLAWRGPRWLNPDGRQIGVCGEAMEAEVPAFMPVRCPDGVPDGSVVALAQDGEPVVWYERDSPDPDIAPEILDASWDADGRGMWLLSWWPGPSMRLLHVDSSDELSAAIEGGPEVGIKVALPNDDLGLRLLALAPDDSVIAVGLPPGDSAVRLPTALVDTTTGRVTYHEAHFGGFADLDAIEQVR